MTKTEPRRYMSKDHLQTVIGDETGRIWLSPQTATRIYFDVAMSSHLPHNEPATRNGSLVLDIGSGVKVRASGNCTSDGWRWDVADLYAVQYPSGRPLTAKQTERARQEIADRIDGWAATHAGDLAQADDIDRNNGARTLEEQIRRHEDALEILRDQLTTCEEGEPFTQYPELPTAGR